MKDLKAKIKEKIKEQKITKITQLENDDIPSNSKTDNTNEYINIDTPSYNHKTDSNMFTGEFIKKIEKSLYDDKELEYKEPEDEEIEDEEIEDNLDSIITDLVELTYSQSELIREINTKSKDLNNKFDFIQSDLTKTINSIVDNLSSTQENITNIINSSLKELKEELKEKEEKNNYSILSNIQEYYYSNKKFIDFFKFNTLNYYYIKRNYKKLLNLDYTILQSIYNSITINNNIKYLYIEGKRIKID